MIHTFHFDDKIVSYEMSKKCKNIVFGVVGVAPFKVDIKKKYLRGGWCMDFIFSISGTCTQIVVHCCTNKNMSDMVDIKLNCIGSPTAIDCDNKEFESRYAFAIEFAYVVMTRMLQTDYRRTHDLIYKVTQVDLATDCNSNIRLI